MKNVNMFLFLGLVLTLSYASGNKCKCGCKFNRNHKLIKSKAKLKETPLIQNANDTDLSNIKGNLDNIFFDEKVYYLKETKTFDFINSFMTGLGFEFEKYKFIFKSKSYALVKDFYDQIISYINNNFSIIDKNDSESLNNFIEKMLFIVLRNFENIVGEFRIRHYGLINYHQNLIMKVIKDYVEASLIAVNSTSQDIKEEVMLNSQSIYDLLNKNIKNENKIQLQINKVDTADSNELISNQDINRDKAHEKVLQSINSYFRIKAQIMEIQSSVDDVLRNYALCLEGDIEFCREKSEIMEEINNLSVNLTEPLSTACVSVKQYCNNFGLMCFYKDKICNEKKSVQGLIIAIQRNKEMSKFGKELSCLILKNKKLIVNKEALTNSLNNK